MKRIRSLIVLWAIALLGFGFASAADQEAQPQEIQFVWKGPYADVPGACGYGRELKETVRPGKGQVSIALFGTRDKGCNARIVLAANPTRSAQIAAEEFNHYVEKMTGERLEIVTDNVNPFEGSKVLIGESKLTRALGLKNEDFQPQEYLVRTYGATLVLMGYDDPETGLIDYEGNGIWPGFGGWMWANSEIHKAFGSCYAVHAFLQDVHGVRWYMPGELGEVCPQKVNHLIAKDLDIRRKPWSVHRSLYPPAIAQPFHFNGSGRVTKLMSQREANLWWLRMKVIGSEAFSANHSITAGAFALRFPDNKEIFAKGYVKPTQLCLTSAELKKIVLQDADDYFAGRANYERSFGDYFVVMPGDDSNYCKCPACQALIKPDAEVKTTPMGFWSDKTSNYAWGFVNAIAKVVKEKHPGKWVSCCAYCEYTGVPDKVKLEDNVAVMYCRVLIDGIKRPGYKQYYQQAVQQWSKTAKRWYLWEYFDHIQGNYAGNAFPGVFLHEIADDIKFLKANGCRGISNELSCDDKSGSLPNIAMDHLNLYVQLRLLDDDAQDVDKMLAEYCRLFYGPAEKPMKAFYTLLEQRFSNPENWKLAPDQLSADWESVCRASDLLQFEKHIQEAVALAIEEPYATRVRLIKEAVYGEMHKHFYNHFFMKHKISRSLTAPRIQNESEIGKGFRVEKFHSVLGQEINTRTEAWVGYDDKNLYVKTKCYEEHMDKLKTNFPAASRDETVCEDDSIEVFIDVGRTRKDFYQVIVNPAGAIFDRKVTGIGSDLAYSSGTVVRVEKAQDHWTMLAAIPFEKLIPGRVVKEGEAWGFNICRNRPLENKGLPRDINETWSLWCPTGVAGFPYPIGFGTLIFGN